MRISLNWLKKYVNVPVLDEELVRLIGARLVEVEGVIDETHSKSCEGGEDSGYAPDFMSN